MPNRGPNKFKPSNKLPMMEIDGGSIVFLPIDAHNVHLHLPNDPTGNVVSDDRDDKGQFKPGSIVPQTAGGLAKKGKVALSVRTSLKGMEGTDMEEYYRAGEAFRKRIIADIRRATGDCSASVSAQVAQATLHLAWSLYLCDEGGHCKNKAERAKYALLSIKASDAQAREIKLAWDLARKEAEGRRGKGGNRTVPLIDDEPFDDDPSDSGESDMKDVDEATGNASEPESKQ